ncbi:MAG: YgfZ/GcvT domain-containing protein [bacterium]
MDTPHDTHVDHTRLRGEWQDAGLISLVGPTAADFLQGYVTCDTARLTPDTALPMAICNLKGRVVASGWLLASSAGIDLLVHASLVAHVQAFLKPYVTFSKCSFAADQDRVVKVNSPQASIALAPDVMLQIDEPDVGATDCSQALNTYLISAGFAFVSKPVSEKFLPQVLNLDNQGAVDFDKGCYLGQEVVARAQFRGAVKRHLISFTDAALPHVGDPWGENGTVVAIDEQGFGLASVKTE